MSELLPCPFCGGEATVERIGKSGYFYVACNTAYCCDFGRFDTEAEAIAAWNTRAEMSYEDTLILLDELGLSERTCRVVCIIDGLIMDEPNSIELSCGHTFETWDEVPPNYCPSCGAKVVD